MADADWVNYKQIRGKALPPETTLLGTPYRLAAHLKRDFYAATGLYERIAAADSPAGPGFVEDLSHGAISWPAAGVVGAVSVSPGNWVFAAA